MANEKAVPTKREVVLAKAVVDLSQAARNLIASRDDIADALRALVDITVEANEAILSALLEGQEALADDFPELFTFGERPVAEGDEDEDEDERTLRVGDWVKVRKPADGALGSHPGPCWVSDMDVYDGAILQVRSFSEYRTDRVKLAGAVRNGFEWRFDVAWLTKLPELPEGFRYLQPDELVAEGDEVAMSDIVAGADIHWVPSGNYKPPRKQGIRFIYRRKVEAPVDAVDLAAEAAVAVRAVKPAAEPVEPPKPAWEPKVGDWVTITRPADTSEPPTWGLHMDRFLGKPHKLRRQVETGSWQVDGSYFYFNPKWLSPWEPKAGDWVKVTKPEITRVKGKPSWVGSMDRYDGKVLAVRSIGENGYIKLRGAVGVLGLGWDFDSSWLSPATAPAPVEPPAEAPKQAWEPKVGDWVTITKPTHANPGWVSPHMDEYDGETFRFEGEFTRDSKGNLWAEGPGGYYFDLAWLSPAPVAVEPPAEAPKPAGQPGQIVSAIFGDAPTKAWQDTVAQIVSAQPSDGHLRTDNGDREFKILSWIAREVDFTQGIVWIESHLRVLVRTHKDKQGEGDVYESLIFRKNLFAPQTGSPIIEYPQGGDLVSKDGVVYLANDWFPSLVSDRPVEVVTLLGVEFHQFSLPKAPVAAVEPPAEAPEVPVGVTGFAALPLDLTQDLMDASVAPEASDEDADEWRVPHPGDVGSIIQARDSEDASHVDSRWLDRKLVAVIATHLEDSPRGTFVCAATHGNETRVCHTWKFARISNKQQPEAPKEEPKPLPHFDKIGKKVVVSRYVAGVVEWHRLGYLVTVSTRPELEGVIEYGVNRFPFDDGLGTDLYYTKNESDSEYRIRLAN